MADIYGKKNGEKLWSDYGKAPVNAGDASAPVYGEEIVDNMAMSYPRQPIVQPLVILPFAGPMQPLYGPDDYGMGMDGGYGYDAYGADYGAPAQQYEEASGKKGRVNALAILSLILGLVAIALSVVSYFVALPEMLMFSGEFGIIAWILEAFNVGIGIFEIALIAALAMTVLTFIVSLLSLKKSYPIVGKIFAAVALIAAIAAVVLIFVNKMTVAIGAYIVLGLMALSALCAIIARRK